MGFSHWRVFDKLENGGNGDGLIDERDEIYSLLRLWFDRNHNGISEPGELFSLQEKGIKALSLDYHLRVYKRDQFGNTYRYRSRIEAYPGFQIAPFAYDVFLQDR